MILRIQSLEFPMQNHACRLILQWNPSGTTPSGKTILSEKTIFQFVKIYIYRLIYHRISGKLNLSGKTTCLERPLFLYIKGGHSRSVSLLLRTEEPTDLCMNSSNPVWRVGSVGLTSPSSLYPALLVCTFCWKDNACCACGSTTTSSSGSST